MAKTTDPATEGMARIGAGATLTGAPICGILVVGPRTLRRWVNDGRFPPPDVRVNARVLRWRAATVEKALAGMTRKGAA
jgi:hypothetical protein